MCFLYKHAKIVSITAIACTNTVINADVKRKESVG